MIRIFFKYLAIIFFLISIFVSFPELSISIRFAIVSIVKTIFTEDRIKPEIKITNEEKKFEIINSNSFEIKVSNLNNFTGYNINLDGSINNQHKSAGLFGEFKDDKINLKLFTRDGSVIENGVVKVFDLPNNYDPHNSSGGIRGIFFIKNDPYGLMVTKNISCQNVTIINLEKKFEIFEADCLPDDQSKIHFDGIGGASTNINDNVLISIGAPTNNYQPVRDLAQSDNSYYGKIISINKNNIIKSLNNKEKVIVSIFSKGHRNPQGLENINNKIFSTEHGPKGGDELNIITKNSNYGWPVSSYGTKYENISSAAYKLNHSKHGFVEPLFQFTPSVAISDLVKCTKQLIDYYEREGCLIATSLKEQSLIIFLLSEKLDRVIGSEIIDFGQRLRHIAKKKNGEIFSDIDGSIFMSTDQGNVIKAYFNLVKE